MGKDLKALKNAQFRRLIGDTDELANWEVSYIADCEAGDFQNVSQNFTALSSHVQDMGMLAAALNGQYRFIRDMMFLKQDAAGMRYRLWNNLYKFFPKEFQSLNAVYSPKELQKCIVDDFLKIDIRIINQWIKTHPPLRQDQEITSIFKRFNQMLRQRALINGCGPLYNMIKEHSTETKGTPPAWLREDMTYLGMKDEKDFQGSDQAAIWQILLEQMSPDWDMSVALYASKTLQPYINYGCRYDDFNHIKNPLLRNDHIPADIAQLKGIKVLHNQYLSSEKFSEDELKDISIAEAFLKADKFSSLLKTMPKLKQSAYIDFVCENLPPLFKKRYGAKLVTYRETLWVQKISENIPKKPSLKRGPRP